MRLFVAVEIPEDLRQKIAEFAAPLQIAATKVKADVKWVRPDRFHFTLKFLGECSENHMPDIHTALETAAQGVRPFPLTLGGLGGFPEQGALRIIWLGAQEGADSLVKLATLVEEACDLAGLPEADHPFSSHLTLGRLRGYKNSYKLRDAMMTLPAEPLGAFTVESIHLVQSKLTSHGPEYTVLREFPLA
jgi:RNA 2',3'-cyclic 3'-phosphodiesterase